MVTEDRPVSALPTVLTSSSTPTVAANPVAARPRQFLSFRLGGEECGSDIPGVHEILSSEAPTRIANAPHVIQGVVSLRGRVIGLLVDSVPVGPQSGDGLSSLLVK